MAFDSFPAIRVPGSKNDDDVTITSSKSRMNRTNSFEGWNFEEKTHVWKGWERERGSRPNIYIYAVI